MSDREPCPFCGCSDLVYIPDDHCVVCRDCAAGGPFKDTEKEAWAAWDARVCSDCAKLKESLPEADQDRANTLLDMLHAIREVVIS